MFSFSHCPIPSLFLILLLLCLLAFYFAFACILIVLPFLSSFLFLYHLLCSLCFYCLILLSPMYLMIMYSVVSLQFLFIISFIHSFIFYSCLRKKQSSIVYNSFPFPKYTAYIPLARCHCVWAANTPLDYWSPEYSPSRDFYLSFLRHLVYHISPRSCNFQNRLNEHPLSFPLQL